MGDTTAVIGLGTMGGRVAARLAGETGGQVRGYDPAPGACGAARAAGITVCDTAAEAVRDAGVVILSLPRPEHVLATVRGPLVDAAPGGVVVDLSTIDPDTARTAAAELGAHRVGYLDAPVLGRPDRCGQWTLAVGGPPAAVERVRPLLEAAVAKRVAHVGEVGAGSVVKLLNNMMFGAINAATAEAFNICRLSGVDPATFASVVADSGAATVSGLFRELARKLPAGDYEPTFALALLQKDNRLALQLARQAGSPAFVAGCVDELNTLTAARDWGGEDTGALYKLYQLLSPQAPGTA